MRKKKKTRSVKELLEDALLRLMIKVPYEEISITMLVQEAAVSRTSYYRLFNSYDEVLDNVVNSLYIKINDYLMECLDTHDIHLWETALETTICHIRDQKIPMLLQKNSMLVIERLNKKFEENLQKEDMSMENKYHPIIKSVIIMGTIKKWMDSGKTESPRELAQFIVPIVLKI